ncbi:MAG: RNA methyltransferase [Neisseriaceae bacterium]|nr:RNA methyltransferase [Neisseriaceae bacterium]
MNKPPVIPKYLQHIRVVLCRPSHPANIGAAARAMKTMGLTRLYLVAPQLIATPMTPNPPQYNPQQSFSLPEESYTLASGAVDVLEQATIVNTLPEALHDTVISCALTSRRRELSVPLQTPRQGVSEILATAKSCQECAIVFGNERFGLSIEESMNCNRLITINGNPDYFSLNLAQAVQVLTYEIFSQIDFSMEHLQEKTNMVTHKEIDGLMGHFADVMQKVGFFERRNSERLLRRLRRLFDRNGVEREEIDILRGFLKTVTYRINKN